MNRGRDARGRLTTGSAVAPRLPPEERKRREAAYKKQRHQERMELLRLERLALPPELRPKPPTAPRVNHPGCKGHFAPRPVYRVDEREDYIEWRLYPSLTQAAKANDASSANIHRVCSGQWTMTAGYRWFFADDR